MNMSRPIQIFVIVAVLSMLAVGAAVFTDAIPGVNAASKDTSPVFDLQDHGGVFVMNPQNRGTSDLVRVLIMGFGAL